MKHLKLFENNDNIQSIRSQINDYNKLISYMEPAIFAKYYELANDPDYEIPYGDELDSNIKEEELRLERISSWSGSDSGLQFILAGYSNKTDELNHFYINLLDDEVEQMLINFKVKNYNL